MMARHRFRHLTIALLIIICVCILGCVIYVTDYYRAGDAAALALTSDSHVTVTVQGDRSVVFAPADSDLPAERGLIFYPGGKVEHTAYAPLLHALAERGWHCVLLKMPCNLAILDMDAAEDVPENFPEIDSWYVGGHSLGGSMAASFLAGLEKEHDSDNDTENGLDGSEEIFDGLILLASYSIDDLSSTDLDVLSVYGSEDLVLNMENYVANRSNLPADTVEFVIDGGCHGYFGDYGMQDGDGIPAISPQEQLAQTVQMITDLETLSTKEP